MKKPNACATVVSKLHYTSPCVSEITVDRDILTESHNDPNMGEWDTDSD